MVLVAAAIAAGLALEVAAYWPGIMTWDGAREYGMVLQGPIDDWHPPVMIVLWRTLLPLARGPGPMLLAQLGLYFGGFALLADWARRRGRPGLATALAAASLFPVALAIEGAVLKDCLMAGAALFAAGLLLLERAWARALAAALLLFAATLRFNAFLACLPLLLAAAPARWRASLPRLAATAVAAALLLLAVTPLANRAIGARPSGVELSLVLFDLGGITYGSGVDAFPSVGVRDVVAVNRGCYDPALWDPYSWWVAAPCPIGFVSVQGTFAQSGASPYGWWLRAVARHPLAYAEHRLRHFNANTRFLVTDAPPQIVPDQPEPNPYGYKPPANPLRNAIDAAAGTLARTPLGWPIWWLAVSLGVLIVGASRPARLMAGSALLYGGGYLVLSVASDLRYHLWTMMASLVAAVLAFADTPSLPRSRLAIALAPPVAVALLGGAARLLG